MKVVNIGQVTDEPNGSAFFTSNDVSHQRIVTDSKELRMNMMNFGKGVRNKFHSHTGDQILIVTKGRGKVATETEEREVTVGDVIFFPAGEKHWHGAAEGHEFSHLTIQKKDGKTTQLEE
jgi:quercetin dioxygenase-like cupin family protein